MTTHDNPRSVNPGLAFVVNHYGLGHGTDLWVEGVFYRLADACECAYKNHDLHISVFDLDTGREMGDISRRNKKTKTWETDGIHAR